MAQVAGSDAYDDLVMFLSADRFVQEMAALFVAGLAVYRDDFAFHGDPSILRTLGPRARRIAHWNLR